MASRRSSSKRENGNGYYRNGIALSKIWQTLITNFLLPLFIASFAFTWFVYMSSAKKEDLEKTEKVIITRFDKLDFLIDKNFETAREETAKIATTVLCLHNPEYPTCKDYMKGIKK